MPGGDSTGPQGQGPMTGWGMGNCVPQNSNAGAVSNFPQMARPQQVVNQPASGGGFFMARRNFVGRPRGFRGGFGRRRSF
jgi:hypothetical protein